MSEICGGVNFSELFNSSNQFFYRRGVIIRRITLIFSLFCLSCHGFYVGPTNIHPLRFLFGILPMLKTIKNLDNVPVTGENSIIQKLHELIVFFFLYRKCGWGVLSTILNKQREITEFKLLRFLLFVFSLVMTTIYHYLLKIVKELYIYIYLSNLHNFWNMIFLFLHRYVHHKDFFNFWFIIQR